MEVSPAFGLFSCLSVLFLIIYLPLYPATLKAKAGAALEKAKEIKAKVDEQSKE